MVKGIHFFPTACHSCGLICTGSYLLTVKYDSACWFVKAGKTSLKACNEKLEHCIAYQNFIPLLLVSWNFFFQLDTLLLVSWKFFFFSWIPITIFWHDVWSKVIWPSQDCSHDPI